MTKFEKQFQKETGGPRGMGLSLAMAYYKSYSEWLESKMKIAVDALECSEYDRLTVHPLVYLVVKKNREALKKIKGGVKDET